MEASVSVSGEQANVGSNRYKRESKIQLGA